jgi:hypothetical protein
MLKQTTWSPNKISKIIKIILINLVYDQRIILICVLVYYTCDLPDPKLIIKLQSESEYVFFYQYNIFYPDQNRWIKNGWIKWISKREKIKKIEKNILIRLIWIFDYSDRDNRIMLSWKNNSEKNNSHQLFNPIQFHAEFQNTPIPGSM